VALAGPPPVGAPGVSVPLYAFEPCLDPRYPALAGEWVVGCGEDGLVDRALNLRDSGLVPLPAGGLAPALAAGQVLFVEPKGTRLSRLGLPEDQQPTGLARFPQAQVSPPGFDGEHLALLREDAVVVGAPGDRGSRVWGARPMGWYPPAIAWPWVAWVEDGGDGDEDVYAVNTSRADPPIALARGPEHQRHVVASGEFLAWVEDERVVVLNTTTMQRHVIPARTGFSAPISLWDDVVCWEQRGEEDIDILCSDGLRADGPGDQRAPSRWGPWLLYRAQGRVWLETAP